MEPATDRTLDQIAAELAAAAGPALPGTLLVRSYACGKRRCRCRADPPALHGPYAEWTRKIGGKDFTRHLTAGQLADLQPLFNKARKIRALIAELQELTLQAIGANDHDNTSQAGHNTVDAAPLTCGQPPGQRPFPQVTAKCEDLTRPDLVFLPSRRRPRYPVHWPGCSLAAHLSRACAPGPVWCSGFLLGTVSPRRPAAVIYRWAAVSAGRHAGGVNLDLDALAAPANAIAGSAVGWGMAVRIGQSLEITDALWDLVPVVG